ncbi:MAG: hypothetical protein NZ828_09480 [Alphaproteobacteria bacterium]|nr:hypothetical protein [Alphaproteobacteria bacterium]
MTITKEFILSAVPRFDQPVLNSLRNSNGKNIDVAVALYNGHDEVLRANVAMLGTVMPQYMAALYFVQSALEENNLDIEWTNIRFLNNQHVRPRIEFNDLADDRLVKHIINDAGKTLNTILEQAGACLISLNANTPINVFQQEIDSYADRLAAAFIRDTAKVTSPQIAEVQKQNANFFTRIKSLFAPKV